MNGHGDSLQDQPRSPRVEKLDGMNIGMRVLSYLIAGVALYGFLGWLGDRALGTGFLLPVGIVLGAGLGCYVIIRRFGRVEDLPERSRGKAMVATPTAETDERAR
jgi:F0F1-type ATP synthase assembly protein I